MFERFTNQARRVVVLAQEEARELNHSYIGTEHLVLGILREGEGAGAQVLAEMNITLEAARREVETRIGRGHQEPSGHIPFTPRAKKSLELALRESLDHGHDYIGSGHLLLGLLRQGDGVGVEVLVSLGADLSAVRGRVIVLLRDDAEQGTVQTIPGRSATVRVVERRPGAIQALLDAIDTRLGAIERHLGIIRPVPDELRAFDEQIAEVVGAKEEAIERQDFAEAAKLREQEKQLRSDRASMERELETASRGEGAGAAPGPQAEPKSEPESEAAPGPQAELESEPEADEVARLEAEVARLTALLREHGIDLGKPQDPPAAAG
jgi:Clp amino terminal domain, pathogenicity island component/UvrB/uvrC motif